MDNQTNNIIKYIIRNVPFGHLKEAIENLKEIVGSEALESEEVKKEIEVYEENHFRQVQVEKEDGTITMLISPFSKDENNYYYDQGKNLKFQATPLDAKIENFEELASSSNPLQILFTNALDEYREANYKKSITVSNGKSF